MKNLFTFEPFKNAEKEGTSASNKLVVAQAKESALKERERENRERERRDPGVANGPPKDGIEKPLASHGQISKSKDEASSKL